MGNGASKKRETRLENLKDSKAGHKGGNSDLLRKNSDKRLEIEKRVLKTQAQLKELGDIRKGIGELKTLRTNGQWSNSIDSTSPPNHALAIQKLEARIRSLKAGIENPQDRGSSEAFLNPLLNDLEELRQHDNTINSLAVQVENLKIAATGTSSRSVNAIEGVEPQERVADRSDATDRTIKPRLLVDNKSTPYLDFSELYKEPWYEKLGDEQKKMFNSFITTDMDKADLGGKTYYYTIKEVLRKIGVNLRKVLEKDPAEFGERETVLAGGYPRTDVALSQVINIYDERRNLKVYDIADGKLYHHHKEKLEQEEMLSDIEFHFNTQLYSLGEVRNHDILIPHPGPTWISGSLAQELNHILGPGSKAYILTDTSDDQKNLLMRHLRDSPELNVNKKIFEYKGDIGTEINLAGIAIKTTHPGPYYIIEVSREQMTKVTQLPSDVLEM